MRKKIAAAALLSLVLLSAAAYAEEDTAEVDEETAQQAQLMGSSHGAEMRLLQLQKSIERNILFGEKVVELIEDNYSSYDTSEMESLIDELEELKEEVAAVDPEGVTDDVVEQFVGLKGDARNITWEFRQLVHDFLNETGADPVEFRAWIGKEVAHDLREFNEEVREAIRKHNAEIVRERLQEFGNQSLVLFEKVRDGSMTPEQANEALKGMLRDMNQDRRKQVAISMARIRAAQAVRIHAAVQNARENYAEKLRERLQERLEQMGERGDLIRQRLSRLDSALSGRTGPGMPPAPPSETGNAVWGGKWK